MKNRRLLFAPACLATLISQVSAQDFVAPLTANKPATTETENGTQALSPMVVKAKAETGPAAQIQQARENYAGAMSAVTPEELDLQNTNNLGDVFARIPGVSYIDEDGRGTKPNIGLRGLDPLRSEYAQLRHDGVPTQPSMYSEPAAYYGVPAERVAGIEIFKGGASILYGPNTVGGVVNLISRPLSDKPLETVLDTRLSSYGDYLANLFLSGTQGSWIYGAEYMHNGGNGFRDGLGYNIDDFEARLGYQFNEDHWAQLHFGYYHEASETPGGLLPYQFRDDPNQSNKPNDNFYGERIEVDLRTSHRFTENQQLETLLYAYTYQRNWFLQNYVDSNTPDLALANSNGQYLRNFDVIGFEPTYTLDYDIGTTTGHQLTLGGRLYHDHAIRRSKTGNTGTASESNSVLNSKDDLTTDAVAIFAENEFQIGDRFHVIPGIRYENIEQTRRDVLAGTARQDKNYDIFLPGLGLKYDVAEQSLVYANVTRSFRPPTFGDSFSPIIGGAIPDLEASTAVTYDLGMRTSPLPWLTTEFGGFYTDYKDQVVTYNQLINGVSTATAANFDTQTYGFEGNAQIGLFALANDIQPGSFGSIDNQELFLNAGATVLRSTFNGGPYNGNDVPNVPQQAYTLGLTYDYQQKVDVTFQGRYAASRFTDPANTVVENDIGTVGELDSYFVFDLKARWIVNENLTVGTGINNIFDETYGTQRRTSQQKGIFPGPTREFYVTATVTF